MGVSAGNGSHGLTAFAVGNARVNPRLNPHPLKPGVYFLPSPLGEGLVWNGWIGGESGGPVAELCGSVPLARYRSGAVPFLR